MNATPVPYRFHAFDVSYFSAVVRPALRYKQLWYRELRADVREIIQRTGMHFIPILITPEDETWQDSTEILLNLEERHPDPPLFPGSSLQRLACDLVELYIDEFGVTPCMRTRWGFELSAKTSRQRFIAMTGSEKQGNLASDQMTAGRFAVGATDELAPAIDAHIRDLLDALSRVAGSYTQWNVVRVLDRYRALPETDRVRVEKELAGTGWEELLAFEPRHRLTKRDFKLAFA